MCTILPNPPLYCCWALSPPCPWKSRTSGVGTSFPVEYPAGRCSAKNLSTLQWFDDFRDVRYIWDLYLLGRSLKKYQWWSSKMCLPGRNWGHPPWWRCVGSRPVAAGLAFLRHTLPRLFLQVHTALLSSTRFSLFYLMQSSDTYFQGLFRCCTLGRKMIDKRYLRDIDYSTCTWTLFFNIFSCYPCP